MRVEAPLDQAGIRHEAGWRTPPDAALAERAEADIENVPAGLVLGPFS